MDLDPAATLSLQPAVELLQRLEPQPRLEDVVAREPDLVLDLTLLPPGGRRTRHRLDQVVRAQLQETPVEGSILAEEHRVHGGAHVVVDPAPAGPAEKGEGPGMGVEHHLLGLARIGAQVERATVAEPDVGDLDRHRHGADLHLLVRPVELVRVARREHQRHERGAAGARCSRSQRPA